MSSSIPVTLLTGFLGAGKTTLLNRLMRSPEAARALIIINEFGSIGLDHDLVEHSNEDDTVVEMASGCLCCTIKGDLQATLRAAPARYVADGKPKFDRVIIETTGLADPAPIIHTIMSDGDLIDLYSLAEIVTLVDGVNGMGTLDAQAEAIKQVAVADSLVVSKADLAEPDVLAELTARLRRLNPAAKITMSDQATTGLDQIFGQAGFNPQLKTQEVKDWLDEEAHLAGSHGHHHHHDHHHHDHTHDHGHDHHHHHDINRHDDRIQSVCMTFDEPMAAAEFDEWFGLLSMLNGVNMLRVKGLINLKEMQAPLVIHGVQHIWHPPAILPDWPSEDRRSRIVFILRDMEESDLRKALQFVLDKRGSANVEGLEAV